MTTPVSVTLSLFEWKQLLHLLADLSDRYSNAGCNDYTIPVTPENYEDVAAFAREIEAEALGGEVDEEHLSNRLARAKELGFLNTLDFGVLGVLDNKLRAGTGIPKGRLRD